MVEQSLEEFVASLPDDLRNIPEVFYAPYGFKLVEINGEKRWQPGTFEEWREVIAKLRGVDKDVIKPNERVGCFNTSPYTCKGDCGHTSFFCGGAQQPGTGYVVCHCMTRK